MHAAGGRRRPGRRRPARRASRGRRRPSSAAIASIAARAAARSASSSGRKTMPTAYAPARRQRRSRRPRAGTRRGPGCRMPAPSPRVRLGAGGAAVLEVAQRGQGLVDDRRGSASPRQGRHEARRRRRRARAPGRTGPGLRARRRRQSIGHPIRRRPGGRGARAGTTLALRVSATNGGQTRAAQPGSGRPARRDVGPAVGSRRRVRRRRGRRRRRRLGVAQQLGRGLAAETSRADHDERDHRARRTTERRHPDVHPQAEDVVGRRRCAAARSRTGRRV